MPIEADTSPLIKFHLPAVKPAFKVENVFSEEIFNKIKKRLQEISWGPGSDFVYHTTMGRWESAIKFDQEIEDIMLETGRKLFGNEELVKTYYYTVRYQKQGKTRPYLQKHMDQNGCQHTIDICIEKNNVEWGIEVDDVVFSEAENAAVCFYGQQQVHSRPKYPEEATDDDYLTVLFLHFVTPDHWLANMNDPGFDAHKAFSVYGADGDVRYYLHTGKIAHPELPEGQEPCACHNYENVEQVVMNRINGIS
jgi:hypothetical protein